MNGALFALTDQENGLVFAWGMEITIDDDPEHETRSAVVYRPGQHGGQNLLSTHESAEAACRAYRRLHPLDITWDIDLWHEAATAAASTI